MPPRCWRQQPARWPTGAAARPRPRAARLVVRPHVERPRPRPVLEPPRPRARDARVRAGAPSRAGSPPSAAFAPASRPPCAASRPRACATSRSSPPACEPPRPRGASLAHALVRAPPVYRDPLASASRLARATAAARSRTATKLGCHRTSATGINLCLPASQRDACDAAAYMVGACARGRAGSLGDTVRIVAMRREASSGGSESFTTDT